MTDPKEKEMVSFEPLSGSVRFDYIKSSQFRVIHVDGIHGGLRPSGTTVHMALFSERNAIPQHEEFAVDGGRLGERTKSEGREAIVREVEVDAIMDLNTARAIRDWLSSVLNAAQVVSKMIPKEKG